MGVFLSSLLHNHTDYSSASRGFADSSLTCDDLCKRAKELGIQSVALTDHECVSGYIEFQKSAEKHGVKPILGNEIYLVSEKQDYALRETNEKGLFFPHFILLALDREGVGQIWKLSEYAWRKAYWRSGLIRTSTTMKEVEQIIGTNKGHVVGSTACLGGFLGKTILNIKNATSKEEAKMYENQLRFFIKWGIKVFGQDNFFLEMQPNIPDSDQDIVNKYILKLSKEYGVKYIITTDSHYDKKENLGLHSAYLNAKEDEGDEREVEEFYATAYVMGDEELRGYFSHWDKKDIDEGFNNANMIAERVQHIDLTHKQVVPKIPIPKEWKPLHMFFPQTEYIVKHLESGHEQDRGLMYLIEQGIRKKIPQEDYKETFERVETELEQFWEVGLKIEDKMSSYFVTMNKNIDICWNEANAIIGVGRGSGVSSIINYLLDITQLNPLKCPIQMDYWRFMNVCRAELPKNLYWA